MEKGYATALFGKCMNSNCANNPYAPGLNMYTMCGPIPLVVLRPPIPQAAVRRMLVWVWRRGTFDRFFEGTGYQNSGFYDSEKEGCEYPWPKENCMTKTSDGTVRKPSSHSQPSTTLNQIRWLVLG